MFKKTTYSDSVIVRDVLAGNQDKFEGLVQRHLPSVFATALAHTHNRADAEDVVQDTFINAYSALDTLRAPAKFGPWILTIARNVARKHLRKRSTPSDDLPEPKQEDSPDTSAQRAELLAMLSDAVGVLPEGEREAILLHYFSGHSARDVAKSLGVSRSAVLKRLERGRARMGKHLLDQLGDKETLKDAMAPSVERITRGVIAATGAWQGSNVAATGGVWAATLSVLPKTSTIAASLAGMGFTAAVGWTYLSQNAEQAEAKSDPIAPPQLVVALEVPTEPAIETEPFEVAAADPVVEQSEPNSNEDPAADPEPEPAISEPAPAPQSSPEETYPTIDGLWDFTYSIAGGREFPSTRLRLSGQGGGIYITGGEVEAFDNIELSRNGQEITATLIGGEEPVELLGEFNDDLTEIVMEGSVPVETVEMSDRIEGLTSVVVRIIGIRVTQAVQDRDKAIEAIKQSLLALLHPLNQYAEEQGNTYPDDLRELYPRYVADENKVKTTPERKLIYTGLVTGASENLAVGQDFWVEYIPATRQEVYRVLNLEHPAR